MAFEDFFEPKEPRFKYYRLLWDHINSLHTQDFMRRLVYSDDLKAAAVRDIVDEMEKAGLFDYAFEEGVAWMCQTHNIWSEDGVYCLPDGTMLYKENPNEGQATHQGT